MSYTEICNLPWMYIFVACVLLFILLQNFIMMRKAWKHAREDLHYTNAQIRKGLTNGILVSIVPTIPVVIVLLTLIPLLGGPLPWLRLSVIGNATIESMAASLGAEAVGETLALGGYTIAGWIAACWVMNLGNSASIVWSILAIRPISKMYSAAKKFDVKLVLAIGCGCLAGVMAFATVGYGASAMATNGVVFFSSFALGALLVFAGKKMPKAKWINDFSMAICMVFGMAVACFVF